MILYGLRLLVALLTFAVGIAAAWLLDFKSAPAPAGGEVRTVSILVDGETPATWHSCSSERRRVVEGGVLQTKTISESSPDYPHYAKVVRLGGKVFVRVEVDEDGKVTKAEARGGFGMLPEAAEKDALATRFAPTRLSGQPVRVTGYIFYNFVLD